MSDIDVSGWSCDERKRTQGECRNGHGCHCREITALRHAAAERSSLVERRGRSLLRVSGWLTQLAVDCGERAKDKRFLSLAEANAKDAKNYRAVVKDIEAALGEVASTDGSGT